MNIYNIDLRSFLRYISSGALISILDLIFFSVFLYIFNNLQFAFGFNYVFMITLSFFIHGKYTFELTKLYLFIALRFLIANIFCFALGFYVVKYSYLILSNPHLSKIIQIFICALFNYSVYRFIVFKKYDEN